MASKKITATKWVAHLILLNPCSEMLRLTTQPLVSSRGVHIRQLGRRNEIGVRCCTTFCREFYGSDMTAFEEIAPFEFTSLSETDVPCLETRETKELLLQWNLNETLSVGKFRFTGSFDQTSDVDYDRLLKDFVRDSSCAAKLGFIGTPSTPTAIQVQQLSTAVKSMDFFDRLEEIGVVNNGTIRGCFEEIYDGISVGDQLRDMLVNDDSENASAYSESEKKELIFVLFQILVIGGSMCQPDYEVKRYQEMTKTLYKELVTVFKNPTTGEVNISGRCYSLASVDGVDIFSNPDREKQNVLLLIVEPLKKVITTLKVNFVSFW